MQIKSLTSNIAVTQYNDVWSALLEWMTENHPDDIPIMFWADLSHPELSPESLALFQQYTDEFVAEVAG